jgi:hypothetical protein
VPDGKAVWRDDASGWSALGRAHELGAVRAPRRAGRVGTVLDAVIEVVLAPALVGAATLAARRWGERIGGLVSAFPAIVGPVLLVAALEHGAAFAAQAASGTLLGLVALSAFALSYATAARRRSWPASLAVGWAAAAVAGLALSTVAAGPAASLAAAAGSLALAHRLLGASPGRRRDAPADPSRPAPARSPAPQAAGAQGPTGTPGRHSAAVRQNAPGREDDPARRDGTGPLAARPRDGAGSAAPPAARRLGPRWDLPLRMALTATLVVSLTCAAGRFGPVAGGILAALPVLASILAAFTHGQLGADAVTVLLRGMLAGMAGFVSFCLLVATLAEPAGIAVAFAAAALTALGVQAATARAGERSAEPASGALPRAQCEA